MTLHRAKPLVFSALLLFISLSIAELSLRLLGLAIPEVDALIGPRRDMTRVIPHPLLDHVGNPEFFEHDARGFRNKRSVDRAHVVALGDSHTYGTGVDAADAWPSVLARQLDEVVYNMGLGGYGAAHNAENVMTALSLKPEHVVFALYPGNDFYDDFRFAMRNGRLAALTSVEEAEKAAALERDSSLVEEVEFLFRTVAETGSDQKRRSPSIGRQVTRWLPEHIRLLGLARALKIQLAGIDRGAMLDRDFDRAKASLSSRQRQYVSVFESAEWKTLLTAPYKLKVMDDADPRIDSGIEVTKQMLLRMRDLVDEAGARFWVLLIPTKEYVFWPRVERPSDHPQLEVLVALEDRLRSELLSFLEVEEIRYIDPAAALRSADEQPYFSSGDGHPNRLGHQIIAKEVFASIGEG